MKFSLLQIGQSFEYKGERYIKATPLVASLIDAGAADSAQQKLIPRSAEVKLLTEAGTAPAVSTATPLEAKKVKAAFDSFTLSLDGLLAGLEAQLDEQSLAMLKTEIETQRKNFLQQLGLS